MDSSPLVVLWRRGGWAPGESDGSDYNPLMKAEFFWEDKKSRYFNCILAFLRYGALVGGQETH